MKDLPGLADLYLSNPRCETVLFPVYVKRGIVEDIPAFETRFSSKEPNRYVLTRLRDYEITRLIEFGA
jgi:hypothetical protein